MTHINAKGYNNKGNDNGPISGSVFIFFLYSIFMNKTINRISHIGDIIAVPFFACLVYYFYNIKDKTLFEVMLFLFSVSGFALDLLFSLFYILET